jgi:hypothetical protein
LAELPVFALAEEVTTAIARFGLASAVPPPPVDDEAWPMVLARIADEKVVGIATAAADDGWLKLTDDQYEGLVAAERSAMTWSLDLERRLFAIAHAFDGRAIPFVVLKGPAMAHGVYPDPSWRPFNDLDILVETSRWRDACGALEAFGWPRRLPEPRRGFDERFGKSAVFTTESQQQIDLHRTLATGPFGIWMDADELFEMRGDFKVGGRTFRSLDATARYVHACVHAVLGDIRPTQMQLRDIVETARDGADPGRLVDLAARWRIGPVIARAASLSSALDGSEIIGRIRRLPSDADARHALAAYATIGRAHGGLERATVRAIPTWSDKVRYVYDLIIPDRRFARARGPRRWTKPFIWLARK